MVAAEMNMAAEVNVVAADVNMATEMNMVASDVNMMADRGEYDGSRDQWIIRDEYGSRGKWIRARNEKEAVGD